MNFLLPFLILLLSEPQFLPPVSSTQTNSHADIPPKSPPKPKVYVQPADFQPLLNHQWAGIRTEKFPVAGEAAVTLTAAVDTANSLNWVFCFVHGTQGDSTLLPIHLSRNGKKLNSAKVVSRSKSKIGTLQLVTQAKVNGTLHRETYFLNFDTFAIQHEEKRPEDAEFRVYHSYILHRK